jgi:uncharacterized heparinase superfamily protein
MFAKILLYYHTIRYLRPIQVQYRIYYTLRTYWRKATGYQPNLLPNKKLSVANIQLIPSIEAYPSYLGNATFDFLNIQHTFVNNHIDWDYPQYGKLWTYNINYFEFLHQPHITPTEANTLIQDFIQKLPKLKNALEPFPTSLRTINWIKFFTQHNIQNTEYQRSLYAQVTILHNHLEYHLLGNHLLENAFALLFAAYYFQQHTWYATAKKILHQQLDEQITDDGAHFELSTMYHLHMLYRVLDCYNLTANNQHPFKNELTPFLQQKAAIMLGWQQQIMPAKFGENYPLFNDSAYNIAPTIAQITHYAHTLNITPDPRPLHNSGYRILQTTQLIAIADVGHIGPTYIPGHAHSDTLSFVLYIQHKPFIVDTGTSTYQISTQRNTERSTAAHNTVLINNTEQSQVWGGFRVAQRATPHIHHDTPHQLTASHSGYHRIGYQHTRQFQTQNHTLLITDTIHATHPQNTPTPQSTAHIHLHPDVQIIEIQENTIKTSLAHIHFSGHQHLQVTPYTYAPQFNKLLPANKIIINFATHLQTTIQVIT